MLRFLSLVQNYIFLFCLLIIYIYLCNIKIDFKTKSNYTSISKKNMRTIQEFDPTDYEFLLKSVIDSRLLFSTKKYIAEHIGLH